MWRAWSHCHCHAQKAVTRPGGNIHLDFLQRVVISPQWDQWQGVLPSILSRTASPYPAFYNQLIAGNTIAREMTVSLGGIILHRLCLSSPA